VPSKPTDRQPDKPDRANRARKVNNPASAATDSPIAEVSTDALVAALESVVTKGLPVAEETVNPLLTNLRSVYARAVVPAERLSRLTALNELLPRLIATIADPEWREATQTLFGLAPGTRKSLLSERQRRAAQLLDYSVGHLRQRVQPDILRSVALLVQEDLLRYRARIKRASESLEPTGDTPSLGPEHLKEEEELISRIWQHVYGLRAELIAHLRLSRKVGYEGQAEDHRQAAMRERDRLRELIAEYASRYGDLMIRQGETEFRAEALERLAGWDL
jgi:hypothetical protein